MELVGPLVDSLCHNMVVTPNDLQSRLENGAVSFEDAIRRSIEKDGMPKSNPRQSIRRRDDRYIRVERRVRSVQRLPLPEGKSAKWVMEEYLRWLPMFMRSLIRCEVEEGGRVIFTLRGLKLKLLELQLFRQEKEERMLLGIEGGVLANVEESSEGRLEFREILGGKYVMAAVHDFSPRLPWYVYNLTQAFAHLFVMRAFGRHLEKC